MNLGQIQAEIQALGYGTDTAAQQVIFINSVYRRVNGIVRWPFLEKQDTSIVTVAGTGDYSMAGITDLMMLDAVRLEDVSTQDYLDIENMDPQSFRDLEQIDRDPSTPYYWTQIANRLHFWPIPNKVYTARIDYIFQPPDLVGAGDTPVWPATYHDILAWGAVELIAYRERDWLGRQFAQTEYTARLKEFQDEYQLAQRQTSSRVKSSGYWDVRRPYPFAHMGF